MHRSPWKTEPFSPIFFIAERNIMCYRIFIWSVQVRYPVFVPYRLLAHAELTHWAGRTGKKDKTSMLHGYCVVTAKQGCVINTVWDTNPKPSTTWTAKEKVSSPSQTQHVKQLVSC